MNKFKSLIAMSIACFGLVSYSFTDVYTMKMSLRIPRVYDNMTSAGYRKYQSQTITGKMSLTYADGESQPIIEFYDFTNMTHKTSLGNRITYDVYENDSAIQRLTVVGNNRTQKFTTATSSFDLIFIPSYSVSDTITEDNSLYLNLAAINGKFKSTSNRKILYVMSGYAVGTVGCACSDYGHISPTRLINFYGPATNQITDVASTVGTWRITYNKKLSDEFIQK